jgi:protein SCO1/2
MAAGAAVALRRAADPPVYWTLPAFALVDQDGRGVRLLDLGGRPFVADFIFTRCAGVCPVMTARMARLQTQIPDGVRLVSITVDPVHDVPAVLKRYAEGVGAGPRWTFLTGPREDVYRLAKDGFKLEAAEVPPGAPPAGDGPFLHSSKFVLVDGRGQVRGYYDSDDAAALERLVADAGRIT